MRPEIYVGKEEVTAYVERMTDQAENALLAAGLQPRHIVALAVTDSLHFLAVYEACLRVGVVPAILGTVTKPAELASRIQAHAILAISIDDRVRVHTLDRTEQREELPADVVVICRTSGSTDQPKFVMWSQEGIDYQSRATIAHIGYAEGERILLTMPLWGAYGISVVHIWRKLNGVIILPEQLRPRYLAHLIQEQRVTSVETMPVLLESLYRWFSTDIERAQLLQGVRIWDSGGDFLPMKLAQNWHSKLEVPILDGYGLSEAGPNVALNSPFAWRFGTIGKPLPGTEVKINDRGELLVKSPSIMRGYWPLHLHPSGIDADGWLNTGDLAEVDADGFVRVLGRTKNLLIVNGYNVIPEVVENVLRKHPHVEAAYVVGQYQGAKGHRVYAFIEPKAGNELQITELRKYATEWLEVPSRPHQYVLLDEVAVKSSGKVDRQALLALIPVSTIQEKRGDLG